VEPIPVRQQLPHVGHSESCRNIYFFCEKNTGATHFQLTANSDGNLPTDEAAGLLAMHCIARGRVPSDYLILVRATANSVKGLSEKTATLLKVGRMIHQQIALTRREKEVLAGLMRCHSNKEIGAQLRVSERTVKFHVSSMLAKFSVRSRLELVRKASSQFAALKAFVPVEPLGEELSTDEGSRIRRDIGRAVELRPALKNE